MTSIHAQPATTDDSPGPDRPDPPSSPSGPSLGAHATRGFAWLITQAVLTRIITLLGSIILANLLFPDDFGKVGLALTVSAFASICQQGGVTEILINRQAELDRYINPAFWISLATGAIAGIVIAAGSPLAAWAYGSDDLNYLLRILAVSMIPASLIIAPEAKLSIQLRFKALAAINVGSVAAQLALAVVFAKLGFGAASMLLPKPIVNTVQWFVDMSLARPKLSWNPQFKLWRCFFTDNATLTGGKLCLTVTQQGDYFVLGVLDTKLVVGLYYFAFSLSTQTMSLIASNLGYVLFPVLSKFEDPEYQTRAFIRAARLLALIGVPVCLLQAGVADPLIRAVFPSKWIGSIPILQILSLGMALRLVSSPAGSLFNAQGRFRTVLNIYIVYAAVFLSAVTVGAKLGSGIGVAIAASACFACLGPVYMYIAIRPGGGTWRDIRSIFVAPVVASACAVLPAVGLAQFIPHLIMPNWLHLPNRPDGIDLRDWFRVAAITITSGILYLIIARVYLPDRLGEVLNRLGYIPMIGGASRRVRNLLLKPA